MIEPALPQPIPLPADFPVTWELPDDAHAYWERETSHYPGQSPMLDWSLASHSITPGFNAGTKAQRKVISTLIHNSLVNCIFGKIACTLLLRL